MPGLEMLCGSKAHRIICMVSRSSSVYIRGMYFALSMPTPCSPVMDKAKYMPRMFTDDDLDTMQMLRCAFDPAHLSNPGKVFPTPRLCGEVPGRHKGAHPLQEAGLAEVF